MNEVVPHPVDVRIHHQRINEPENQHHPQRRVRKQEVEPRKVSKMEKPGGGGHSVPTRVREERGISSWTFYSNRVGLHRRRDFRGDHGNSQPWPRLLSRKIQRRFGTTCFMKTMPLSKRSIH